MPSLIDTETRTDVLVWAINDILVNEGVQALALRRVAKVSGVSTSSMLHHFGSCEHLMRVVAHRTGTARVRDVAERSPDEGVTAFLPGNHRERSTACAWLVWQELSRCEPAWQRTVDDIRETEQRLVARTLGLPWHHDDVIGMLALVDGLVAAMCRPTRPVDPTDAQRCLTDHLQRLGHPVAES